MPQPALDVIKYLSSPLPALREQYPPGTGGTGARAEWSEGTLKGVEVLDGFKESVDKCECAGHLLFSGLFTTSKNGGVRFTPMV